MNGMETMSLGEKPLWAKRVMSTHITEQAAWKARNSLMEKYGRDRRFQIAEVRHHDWIRTVDPWAVVEVNR
jgi:hypothetical protein